MAYRHSFRHTIQGAKDTGSTTLLSADLIEDLHLFAAGSSAKWNGNSAGFINMTSRSGNTGLSEVADGSGMNSLDRGRFVSDLVHLELDWFAEDRLTARSTSTLREQTAGIRIPNGPSSNATKKTWSESGVSGISSSIKIWTISSEVTAERWSALNRQKFFQYGSDQRAAVSFFDVSTSRQELFVEASVPVSRKVTLLGGWSRNRQARIVEPNHSPYAGLELTPSARHQIFFWLGRSGQFSFFKKLSGITGNAQLLPEVANASEARWSYRDQQGYGLSLYGYYRWREKVPWRYQGLWRLEDGEMSSPSPNPYLNLLEDRSYGREVVLGRELQTD